MNLNYITLGLDYDLYSVKNNELRYEFQQFTCFIGDYFSKSIRKLKFKTDGTFNMISIELNDIEVKRCSIVPDKVLKVELTFNQNLYESTKGTSDFSYYLEMLEKGFFKAAEFKDIPLESMLYMIESFKQGGCKNEWIHKKKLFQREDIEVILKCYYTTYYFQLWVQINQISTRKKLVQGVILQTEVGVSIHEGMFNDIFIIDHNIIITDKFDSHRILINKHKIFQEILDYKILGDKYLVEMLSYKIEKQY